MLAFGMIIFAAATYKNDTQIGSQLIIGGVALLSITLTGYTAFATYQDTKLWTKVEEVIEASNPQVDAIIEQENQLQEEESNDNRKRKK
jgi:cytochrome c-type biogenesis protein CcmH/NrfG